MFQLSACNLGFWIIAKECGNRPSSPIGFQCQCFKLYVMCTCPLITLCEMYSYLIRLDGIRGFSLFIMTLCMLSATNNLTCATKNVVYSSPFNNCVPQCQLWSSSLVILSFLCNIGIIIDT